MSEPRILKKPTTFREQLDILIDRGMVVEDETKALTILQRINYYRFTAYTLTFKKDDKFFSDTTFDKIYNHYQFDTKFRNLLMEIIEYIEISFRTQISNLIAIKYGSLGHENKDNFRIEQFHTSFMEELQRLIDKSKRELAIAHYRENYEGQYPIWVVSEIITFGIISKLYKNMKTADQKNIARTYYLQVDYRDLDNWLEVLTIVRNRCAHYSRLFNYKMPKIIKYHKDETADLRNNLIFGIIYNSKFLVTDRDTWRSWVTKLESLISEYTEVDIRLMGFPEKWHSLLIDQSRRK
ncbi:Abi family protein [Paenibacillus sp. URB8-2]|uniref:Abi family protein n=1 Tax=Paenibacillus sp. URB8-2 TaxID=2741301 RepID=UPI0015C0687B|nr:Abi family protein [Paenibacillus sp. URB8-2]BCG57790.1 CAAX amino protease [Paenibacillus sp. URB8-2]